MTFHTTASRPPGADTSHASYSTHSEVSSLDARPMRGGRASAGAGAYSRSAGDDEFDF
jgi:hypothetical protein